MKRLENADGTEGRVMEMRITLSDWLFNAFTANEVLSMHPDYFRLRKPIERRLYEIARKHCGMQASWRVGVDVLYKKTGSRGPVKQFRYISKELEDRQHLPDYEISMDQDARNISFQRRNAF